MNRRALKWMGLGSVFLTCILLLVFFYPLLILNLFDDEKIPTVNGFGWMNNPIDPITEEFLIDCHKRNHPIVLEIGAGTGSFSLKALEAGAFVWVNDLDKENLHDFSNKVPLPYLNKYKLVIGDFPNGVDLPESYFDSILAIRVLHFFRPKKLEEAISKMYTTLKSGGKVFILVSTPYFKEVESFIPEYEERKKKGDLYPGYITNFSHYNSQFKTHVPEEMHFLDQFVLRREFEKAGFIVEQSDFIKEKNPLTQHLTENRAFVGLIGQKP